MLHRVQLFGNDGGSTLSFMKKKKKTGSSLVRQSRSYVSETDDTFT